MIRGNVLSLLRDRGRREGYSMDERDVIVAGQRNRVGIFIDI